jgi:hypothetical protein
LANSEASGLLPIKLQIHSLLNSLTRQIEKKRVSADKTIKEENDKNEIDVEINENETVDEDAENEINSTIYE